MESNNVNPNPENVNLPAGPSMGVGPLAQQGPAISPQRDLERDARAAARAARAARAAPAAPAPGEQSLEALNELESTNEKLQKEIDELKTANQKFQKEMDDLRKDDGLGKLDDRNKLKVVEEKLANNEHATKKAFISKKELEEKIRLAKLSAADRNFYDENLKKEAAKKKLAEENQSSQKKREDRFKNIQAAIGNNINLPKAENSALGKISHLSGFNWEGIAIGMLMDELFLFLQVFSTLCLGQYGGGQMAEDMNRYNTLKAMDKKGIEDWKAEKAKNPDTPDYIPLCYDKTQKLYEVVLQIDGTYAINYNNEIKDRMATSIEIMANGYFPKPNTLDSLNAEFQHFIMGQLGVDSDPARTAAYKAFESRAMAKASQGPEMDDRYLAQQQAMQRPTPRPA